MTPTFETYTEYRLHNSDNIAHLKEGCVLYMANKPVNFPDGHE